MAMAIAETIECLCNECNILLCISLNDWIEVSTSYSTYERPGAFTDPGLEPVEQIREGSKDSELDGCLVKPLRCYGCKTLLGMRCVEAAVEKRANVNRSYLKLAKMTLKSITSGNLVEARIKPRQKNGLETSPKDPLGRRPSSLGPTSSKKYSALHKRDSEVEHTETPSSDQVFDLTIGPTADPVLILEEQRRDIDRIMASVDILQQDMISLKDSIEHLEHRRDQASHHFVEDVDILTDNITKVGSRLGELDALKLEMKMMQQRIKRMEESRSTGRRSSTVLDSAEVSRWSSPTIDQALNTCNDAPSNGFLSASQRPLSAYSDGLFAPRRTATEKPDVVDGGDSSYRGLPVGFNDEPMPHQALVTTSAKTSVNHTTSKGSQNPVNMPPPQVPRKGPEQKFPKRSSSIASHVAAPRTASTSVTGTTKSTSFPRLISQMQEASSVSHYDDPESPIYDDELVNDLRPRSSTGSSTRSARQPANVNASSRQNRDNGITQQPPPRSQNRQSLPMRLPIPERERPGGPDIAGLNKQDQPTRGLTAHRDRKRRKVTAFSTDTPSTSIWATDSRGSGSSSGRRNEQSLSVRINEKADGRSAGFQNRESPKRQRPGNRDEEGYLLTPDGTRDPRSVKSVDGWKKRKAEAELSG